MTALLCAALLILEGQDGEHFPLAPGSEWIYALSTGATMKVRVVSAATVRGVECAVVETSFGAQATRDFLALTPEGLQAFKAENRQSGEFPAPILRAKLPFREGEVWTVRLGDGPGASEFEYRTGALEPLQVLGKSADCRKVTTVWQTSQGRATMTVWYARGVGMVRQEYQLGAQSMTAELTRATLATGSASAPAPAAGVPPAAPGPRTEGPVGAREVPRAGEFVRYESKDGKALLYHPKGWKVQEAGDGFGPGTYALSAESPEGTSAVLFMTFTINGTLPDSIALANTLLGTLRRSYPDLDVGQMTSSQDRARTSVEATYTDGDRKMSSHLYFFHSPRAGTLYALAARQDLWEASRPTLTSIVANLAYAPEGISHVLEQGREQASRPPAAAPPEKGFNPVALVQGAFDRAAKGEGRDIALEKVVAQDGSFSMAVPRGWSFEGASLAAYATPDARALQGYSVQMRTIFIPGRALVPTAGMLVSPYLPPARALEFLLVRSKLCQNIRILSAASVLDLDPDTARKVWKPALAAGAQVDNRLLLVEFTNVPTGTVCRGIFSITCTAWPLGLSWTCGSEGSWAPAAEYDRWLPVYARMANSSEQNTQWVQQKSAQQAAESARLQKNLMKSMNELSQAYERKNQSWWESQKSHDYTSWAFSQTTLGQGSWVSEREGAVVVRSDAWGLENTRTGQTTNVWNHTTFTGQNPWTGEQLNEVSTRAEYEKYIRGR